MRKENHFDSGCCFGQFSFRVRPYGIWESESHFLKTVPLHIFLFSMCAVTWKRLSVFREHQCWQYSISHSCFPTWLANPSLYWTSPRRTSSHPCCEEGLPPISILDWSVSSTLFLPSLSAFLIFVKIFPQLMEHSPILNIHGCIPFYEHFLTWQKMQVLLWVSVGFGSCQMLFCISWYDHMILLL